MARPKTKEELLQLSQANFTKLMDFINSMSEKEQETAFLGSTMNRNIRDVLGHLHEWHTMMLNWYTVGMSGKKPAIPAEGYTWKTTPELNKKIWEEYQKRELDEVKSLLKGSFSEMKKIIEKHTNDELFEKKKYKWTGTTSLGAYLISATSSHYDWALKLIKKSKKTRK